MARIDEDIVAKASFYAGLANTFSPEDLPSDIRDNGNSLLRDVVDSICQDREVDRGQIVISETTDGVINFTEDCGIVPHDVMFNGGKLTMVGLEDFLTTYRNNAKVCCVHHSVVDSTEINPSSIIIDQFGRTLVDEDGNVLVDSATERETFKDVISVKTWVRGNIDIICDKAINVDDSLGYLRVDCRNAVRSYIVDALSFRMASMYGVATKDDCYERMLLSLNHCKKVVAPHLTLADPYEGMKRMMNANNSPRHTTGSNFMLGG